MRVRWICQKKGPFDRLCPYRAIPWGPSIVYLFFHPRPTINNCTCMYGWDGPSAATFLVGVRNKGRRGGFASAVSLSVRSLVLRRPLRAYGTSRGTAQIDALHPPDTLHTTGGEGAELEIRATYVRFPSFLYLPSLDKHAKKDGRSHGWWMAMAWDSLRLQNGWRPTIASQQPCHARARGPRLGNHVPFPLVSASLLLGPPPGPPDLPFLLSRDSRNSHPLPPFPLHVGRSPLVYISCIYILWALHFPGPPPTHALPPTGRQLTRGLTLALPDSRLVAAAELLYISLPPLGPVGDT